MPAATLGATADMRPRLLEHVRFADSDDGVYLESDHGACTISGRHGYTWLSRLAPHLTGEHTLAELVEPLSADRRQLVEQLVAALAEQGFVVDARPEEPHTLSPGERATYQPEIAFIRYGADSAERRFERLREARVVLHGGGPVLGAVLEAGLRSGWRQVLAIDTGVIPADLAAAVVRGRRDAAQDVRITTAGAGDVLPPDVLPSKAGVLLHVHDGEHPDELVRMSRACAQRETALGQIWVRGAEAWLRPVTVGESESCWHRLTAMPYEEKPGESGSWLTGAVPAVLAAQLALSCFEHLTGTARSPGQPVLTRVDLCTLETHRHRAHAHPRVAETHDRAGRCEETDVRAAFDRLAGMSPVESGDLLARVAAYVDRRTGVLGSLGAEGLVQVPMAVCRAVVSDPYGVLPAWSTARESRRGRGPPWPPRPPTNGWPKSAVGRAKAWSRSPGGCGRCPCRKLRPPDRRRWAWPPGCHGVSVVMKKFPTNMPLTCIGVEARARSAASPARLGRTAGVVTLISPALPADDPGGSPVGRSCR
ncbi:hypothetical protein [Streptosporangium canum]|uniref:hypothetical protein n=1 Tax=Streptosporangium canum TaxID=324952 RepID=UPI0037ACDFB2